MKTILSLAFALLILQACAPNESIFVLSPAQSMSITGQGPGQDAAKNPYADTDSFAQVKNLGENEFSVRIQNNGAIVKEITIQPGEKREVKLPKGYQLFLDSEMASVARLDFKSHQS